MPVKRITASKPCVPVPSDPTRLMRIPQAAAYLACTVWSIRDLIKHGQLPHIRIGKRFLIDRQDLDAFIARSKQAAA